MVFENFVNLWRSFTVKRLFFINLVIFFVVFFSCIVHSGVSSKDMYKVGINDIIRVDVLGHKDLEVIATVAVDGTISFPHLGSVYVKDKTLEEIKKELTEKLSEGYVKFPVVSVSLIKTMSKNIFINGEVAKIGAIPFEKDMTIIKALSMAGGIREGGHYGKLKVRRGQKGAVGYKNIVESELDNGIIKNKEIEDMLLQPDDILIVERNKTFLIKGEVTKRGKFIITKDMTVLRAILEAGGVSADGLYGTIKIRRKEEGETGGYKVYVESKLHDGVIENKEVEDTLLQPDDILIVERNKTFLIKGEIAKRGRFILDKDMTVLRALLEAGGVKNDGLYGMVKVRRKKKGETGGYKVYVESKLNDGVIEDKEVEDMLLQLDDILIVERNKKFFIYGEVNRTGEFVLQNDMTVFKAITNAGGFTKWGSPGGVKVLRKINNSKGFNIIKVNIEEVLNGNAAADMLLEPGDTVVVATGIF
jgi:polysaccharide export outer membrane protein